MSKAPIPMLEKLRLFDIAALDNLSGAEEKSFGDFTVIAASLLNMPIATVSIVEADTQVLRFCSGVAPQTIPRDCSICAHAIMTAEPTVIEDLWEDSRFADLRKLKGFETIRFYAGARILSSNGHAIGTLNVMDHIPRQLDPTMIAHLETLAAQLSRLLVLKSQVAMIDLEQQKNALQAAALSNLAQGVVVRDTQGKTILVNSAANRIMDQESGKLDLANLQNSVWQLYNEADELVPFSDYPANQVLRTGEAAKEMIAKVFIRDQDLRWLKLNSVPISISPDLKISHTVTTFIDITSEKIIEQKQTELQLQLLETARLSTLGEMAGGVAHEINNPLAIIKGRINLMQARNAIAPTDQSILSNELNNLDRAVDRIAKIVRGLRTYARDASGDEFTIENLGELIEETVALCSEKFKFNSVQITYDCPPEIFIPCRPAQISQVIMSLLSNSFDAIQLLDEKWVTISCGIHGNNVQLILTDSGLGIPLETVRRMMNPFFTTKDVGKGTGLGLSISQGILKAHDGDISYLPGPHTTFKVILPATVICSIESA